MDTAKEIVKFWFEDCEEKQWFEKDEAFDALIRERFGSVYEQAMAGTHDHWEDEPESCIALVVLLDQFPRNMFRGSARMYEADAKVLAVAKRAVDTGLHLKMDQAQRRFLYLPFEHSEDLDDQNTCMELMAALDDERSLEYARKHLVIIERFGRFPHRNDILGRPSTPEETEFLKEPDSSF